MDKLNELNESGDFRTDSFVRNDKSDDSFTFDSL